MDGRTFSGIHYSLCEEVISELRPGGSEVMSRGRSFKAKATAMQRP